MKHQRWLRIIPVALIMYTISYVDRTNISLSLDPKISRMMQDLQMDDRMKGEAAGVFFFGYLLLQIPGGWLASRWSARKVISLCLFAWGLCAMSCGLARTFREFEVIRFFLGVAESAVFPATLVLLANWFPRAERARANAGWQLYQPLAVVCSAPLSGWLLGAYGWKPMMILEGALPFLWLPVWWICVRDHPREAEWISPEERNNLENTLRREGAELEPAAKISLWQRCLAPSVFVMIPFYFLHNAAVYGCMTFFTDQLKNRGFSAVQYGLLLAFPYALTAVAMVLNSWHSDKTQERRGHIALAYGLSGLSLLASVLCAGDFWLSYAFACLAIPGPLAGMAPFWCILGETLPASVMGTVMGLVNAFGNLGGFAGPYIVGLLVKEFHNTNFGFDALGSGMLVCAGLAFLLPKATSAPSATREKR
jgi:MFS family permease